MSLLFTVAEEVLVNRVLSNKAPVTGRSKLGLIIIILTTLFVLAGLGFALYSATVWLNTVFSAHLASLIMAGALFTLALFSSALFLIYSRYKQSKVKEARQDMAETIEMGINLINKELSEPVSNNPKQAMLIASLAGFVAGDKFL